MESVTVDLGNRSYPILIGHGVLQDFGSAYLKLGLGRTVAIVTNPTVAELYLEPVRERKNLLGIAWRIFDEHTFKDLSALPKKNLVYEFKRHWTTLEAKAKAKGISLFNKIDAGDTDCINFEPMPGWMAAVATTAPLPDIGQWCCYQFKPREIK